MDQQKSPEKTEHIKKPISLQRLRTKFLTYFTEYCDNTSIHGFRYLGERRSSFEKFWWLVTITISITLCIILIIQTYDKWERSPVIVSFATKQTPIWNVPFPAITVCPEIKANKHVYNFTDVYKRKQNYFNTTTEEDENFEKMALVCKTYWRWKWNVSYVDDSFYDFLDEIAPNMDQNLFRCEWGGKFKDCGDLFTPIITRQGICYSFNMLDRKEMYQDDVVFYKNYSQNPKSMGWKLDSGYGMDFKKYTYPRRALFSGAQSGLNLVFLTIKRDIDYLCGDSLQGFKAHIHHPAKLPRVTLQYFRVPLDQAVSAGIDMNMMVTSEALRGYSSAKRKCYFSEEKKLRFFRIYAQENCEIECISNYTLRMCGCIPFYMPRAADMPICGPAKEKCVKDAEFKRLTDGIDYQLQTTEKEKNDEKLTVNSVNERELRNFTPCDCLPSCTSLTYNTETSQNIWDWVQHDAVYGISMKFLNLYHKSQVRIFFKEMQYVASERDELYGHTDFLANCGGLLGLFTGFSVISLIEIIYFMSLRLGCNIHLYGLKFWSGKQQ